MNTRTSILVLVAAMAGCTIVALCAALGIGGYSLYTRNASLAFPGASASVNQIVYVGNDNNIYIADAHSGNRTALTQDGGAARAYNYPTWAPNNQRVAFVGYTFENGAPKEGALYTISPRGEKLTPIFKTLENFPFYLYWSPDSQFVAFLSNKDSQKLALRIARADQADSMQELDIGAPFYWAWSPDSAQMFTHVGGAHVENDKARLAVVNVQTKNAPQALDALPGAFQAPQWSRDGKILFSTLDGGSQIIALSDAQHNLTKLTDYRGRATFALSPDAARIAYLVTPSEMRVPNYGEVRLVNANGENNRVVSPEPALAFQWSPDSKKIAFLTLTLSNNQQNFRGADSLFASNVPPPFVTAPRRNQDGMRVKLNWLVWDSETNQTTPVASFLPTPSFLNVLPYFDQYANSSTFWSPDSQALVYTARTAENAGAVFIADITGTTQPKQIGEGVLAFWSWR